MRLRKKAPKRSALKEMRARSKLYNKAMSYRLYRPNKRKSVQKYQETDTVREYIERMELLLKKPLFLRHDRIRVLKLLERFVKEANIVLLNCGNICEEIQHPGDEKAQ